MRLANINFLKLSPWMIMAAVFLYTAPVEATMFTHIVVGFRVEVDWYRAICANILLTFLFFLVSYILGLGVLEKGWKVYYTQGILRFFIYLFPVLIMLPNFGLVSLEEVRVLQQDYSSGKTYEIGGDSIALLFAFTGVVVSAWLYCFSKSLRDKIGFIHKAFCAIEGEEPKALTWQSFRIEVMIIYGLLVIYHLAYTRWHTEVFSASVWMAMLILCVGNGLSGVIAAKENGNTYQVKTFFSDKAYSKSKTASVLIFVVTFFTAMLSLSIDNSYSPYMIYFLFTLPIIVTFVDAKTPYKWSGPAIVVSTIVSIWIIITVYFYVFRILSPY